MGRATNPVAARDHDGYTPAEYRRLRERALARLEAFPSGSERLSAIDALIDAERDIERLRREVASLDERYGPAPRIEVM